MVTSGLGDSELSPSEECAKTDFEILRVSNHLSWLLEEKLVDTEGQGGLEERSQAKKHASSQPGVKTRKGCDACTYTFSLITVSIWD